jgi:hypothetical protein
MAADINRAQQVKDLAEAVSTQAQVSNRTWLGLITVAVIALLPRIPEPKTPSELSLPFGFGNVDATFYYLILFGVLVVLTVAFVAAHAQQVRAGKLAQDFVSSIALDDFAFAGMQPRELYDMLRTPSLNRVAPLAQLLRGPLPVLPHWCALPGLASNGKRELLSRVENHLLACLLHRTRYRNFARIP